MYPKFAYPRGTPPGIQDLSHQSFQSRPHNKQQERPERQIAAGWNADTMAMVRRFRIGIKNSIDRAPRLTPCEEEWIRLWRGGVAVVTSVADAICVVVQDGDYEDAANLSK